MPSRTAKKRKGNPLHAPCIRGGASTTKYYSLMVPLTQGDSKERVLLMQQTIDRLSSIGYSHVAFCHTVYGKVKPDDAAETTFGLISKLNRGSLQVLTRLHIVVENLADVGHYTAENASIKLLLQNYDLVSLSPRNDAVFAAACSTATLIDIITLDYTSGRGGVQLPYKIRTLDVKAACKRGAVFEMHYSPAILTLGQRKAFVATAQALQSSSLGSKPKVLLSSGDSNALRAPGDLINLMKTVLLFNPTISFAALSETGNYAIQTALRRKFGTIADIYTENKGSKRLASEVTEENLQVDHAVDDATRDLTASKEVIKVESDTEDGFITF